MKTFTSSDLKQNVGDVLMAAAREPVSITKHDKARYVLMDVSLFSAAPCSHLSSFSFESHGTFPS